MIDWQRPFFPSTEQSHSASADRRSSHCRPVDISPTPTYRGKVKKMFGFTVTAVDTQEKGEGGASFCLLFAPRSFAVAS
eukprot:scaffold98432_cov33-Tisochrysis_lutea.AAC.5